MRSIGWGLTARAKDRPEAEEMAARGFRFSIYDPTADEFKLTIPYQAVRTTEAQTLTSMQGWGDQ